MDSVFKCKIINYQRIKSANMEFIPGLNVIVGESNNGKTAVLRSLETAIYNIPREEHITLGETKSAVGIQYNGHEVIWRRDKEKASQVTYRVDGKIYQKLGRGQPQEVADALGIQELDINDKKFRLNFSKQMSYPFLLDSTPSDMFKFIAQSSGEDNLIEVLKQMKKDVSEISSNVKAHEEAQKVLGESLVQLEKHYNSIKDQKDYCDEVINLESKVSRYNDLKEKIETYKRCSTAVDKMNNSLNYMKGIVNDLNSSISVSESHIKKLSEIEDSISKYENLLITSLQLSADISRYKNTVESLSELDSYYEGFRSQGENTEKASHLRTVISRYSEYQTTCDNINQDVENLSSKLERYNKFIESIKKVLDISDEKEETLSGLRLSIENYSGLDTQKISLAGQIAMLEESLRKYEKEIEEIGVCPYCGSVLTGGSHGQCSD